MRSPQWTIFRTFILLQRELLIQNVLPRSYFFSGFGKHGNDQTFLPSSILFSEFNIMNDRQEHLLLASLSRKERERLEPFLHPVEVELSEVLIKANEPITP